MEIDSPDLVTAMRLLDDLKLRGFQFQRVAPGEDGPLGGHRINGACLDLVHIEGFSQDCFAWRKRASSLIVSDNGPVERQTDGSAIDVLNEVLRWDAGS